MPPESKSPSEDLEIIDIQDYAPTKEDQSFQEDVDITFPFPQETPLYLTPIQEAEGRLPPFQFDTRFSAPTHTEFPAGSYKGNLDKEGLQSGPGEFIYNNGSKYIGYWKAGKPSGNGRYIGITGEVYEGEWKSGKANGKGKKVYLNGRIYEGDWVDGKQEGPGLEIWPDKSYFKLSLIHI